MLDQVHILKNGDGLKGIIIDEISIYFMVWWVIRLEVGLGLLSGDFHSLYRCCLMQEVLGWP